jgi:FeS assembly protein IscX
MMPSGMPWSLDFDGNPRRCQEGILEPIQLARIKEFD